MPQATMHKEQQQTPKHDEKTRCKHPKGITMEDLKYQTAMRLAQEQSRRESTFSNNKRLGTAVHFDLNKSPVIGNGYFSSPSNSENTSRYSGAHEPSGFSWSLTQETRSQGEKNRYGKGGKGIMNSKKFQECGEDEYQYNGDSSSFSQTNKIQTVTPTVHYKRQASAKTYRHGLTVQELKEMTRARLAAEANVSDQRPGMQNKNYVDKMNRNFNEISWKTTRERVQSYDALYSDVSIRHRLNSAESTSSAPAAAVCQIKESHINISQDSSKSDFTYQVQQTNLHTKSSKYLSRDNSVHPMISQDIQLSVYKPYTNDPFDNSSVHSSKSVTGSECHVSVDSRHPSSQRSENHSSYLDSRSICYPVAIDCADTVESQNRNTRGLNSLEENVMLRGSVSSTELSNLYEEKLSLSDCSIKHNTSAQLPASSLFNVDSSKSSRISSPTIDPYRIFGQCSSETEPTMTLSADSFCGSDENNIIPIPFSSCDRNISDGAISGNGELPNSVAESVLTPSTDNVLLGEADMKHRSFSTVRPESNTGRYYNNALHPRPSTVYKFCSKKLLVGSRVKIDSGKTTTGQGDLAKFLDDFEFRISSDSKTDHPSSLFKTKIDSGVNNQVFDDSKNRILPTTSPSHDSIESNNSITGEGCPISSI